MVASAKAERISPAVCAERVAQTVASLCRKQFGGSVKAVVLTGSLARNEGSICTDRYLTRVLGDAEFLIVFHDPFPLPAAHAITALKAEAEEQLLKTGIDCRISLSASHSRYLRRMRAHIFGYELRHCGKVAAGELDILDLIPCHLPSSIPGEDAWCLLSNRIVEQCVALANAATGDAITPTWCYATVKLYLDMATSWLVFVGGYSPTYAERELSISAFARLPLPASLCPFEIRQFAARVKVCTAYKLNPEEHPGAVGLAMWLDAVDCARRLWYWELAKIRGDQLQRMNDQVGYSTVRIHSFSKRIRGWVCVFRSQGWFRSWRLWLRWLRHSFHGSPREAVYAAASALLFHMQTDGNHWRCALSPREIAWLQSSLPVLPQEFRHAPGDWRNLARAIDWNYQNLLMGNLA